MGAVEKDVLLILHIRSITRVYKFKFDLQPGSLTDQVAGEHQPSKSLVTMGLDLQPDVFTAGLAGHCQLDKKPSKNIHKL